MTNDGRTPLYLAAIENYQDICKLLMPKIEDKNPADENGVTPLHWAAHYGYFELYNYLLERVEEKNPQEGIENPT